MNDKPSLENTGKSMMHPRNLHRERYDFELLCKACPELSAFVTVNKFNTETIDFADPLAVKMLNKALLKYYYHIDHWDLPDGYLCPPIPGRADYIHHMADLLATSNKGVIPTGDKVRVLDIGVGANCVYPILGHQSYGWHFVGSDTDAVALKNARLIIKSNPSLKGTVECRQQTNASNIFSNIIQPKEVFSLSVCNPPFHASQEEATAAGKQKMRNLHGENARQVLNFGGKSNELFYQGGEAEFVRRMIKQSSEIPDRCLWFSTLISQKSNLYAVTKLLQKVKATDVRTIEMAQGNKHSRIVVWSFQSPEKIQSWFKA